MIIERGITGVTQTSVDAALLKVHEPYASTEIDVWYEGAGPNSVILKFEPNGHLIGGAQAEEYADMIYQAVLKEVQK